MLCLVDIESKLTLVEPHVTSFWAAVVIPPDINRRLTLLVPNLKMPVVKDRHFLFIQTNDNKIIPTSTTPNSKMQTKKYCNSLSKKLSSNNDFGASHEKIRRTYGDNKNTPLA